MYKTSYFKVVHKGQVNTPIHIVISFFEASLLIVPIYHALVASWNSLEVYKTKVFLDKTKLADAHQERSKSVLNCRGDSAHKTRTELP